MSIQIIIMKQNMFDIFLVILMELIIIYFYCFYREKMAFFTRPGVSVPVPPTKSSQDPKSTETRYNYTVDRVFGVEV